jgi:hypothetical protein
MQSTHPSFWLYESLDNARQLITQDSFCHQHRAHERAFTRKRCFTFATSVLFILQKTVRSVQLHLHSFFAALAPAAGAATSSAWSQARSKLRYTAFVALNQEAVLQVVYRDPTHPELRRWQGHRLVAIDSSLLRLPNQESLGQEFGWVECQNNTGECGRYPQARLSVLTDVLNKIALETWLEPWTRGERQLAQEHLKAVAAGDVALMDRGFADYYLWACFVGAQRRFVCRCQANTFGVVKRLFKENQAGRSVVAELVPHREQLRKIQEAGLPTVLKMRFVTVRLQTGELEVLATNLLDEELYPEACLGGLYHYRWGVETYYGLLKGRLDLGHFTGLSAEAIRQDVYSTVFVSNLESLLIAPANQQLERDSQGLKHRQQVNHAVSFHAIKTHLIALLAGSQSVAQVLEKLERLFLATPTTVRPKRIVPRTKASAWRSYYHQRQVRKAVF